MSHPQFPPSGLGPASAPGPAGLLAGGDLGYSPAQAVRRPELLAAINELNNVAATVVANLEESAAVLGPAGEGDEEPLRAQLRSLNQDSLTAGIWFRSVQRNLMLLLEPEPPGPHSTALADVLADNQRREGAVIRRFARFSTSVEGAPVVDGYPTAVEELVSAITHALLLHLPTGQADASHYQIVATDPPAGPCLRFTLQAPAPLQGCAEQAWGHLDPNSPKAPFHARMIQVLCQRTGARVRPLQVDGQVIGIELALLRAVIAPLTPPTPPLAASLPRPRGREARRVLVIDDEPLLLRSYQRVLNRVATVVTAAGGEEAIALLREDSDFDLILCDLMMPGKDGADVLDWLEAHHPDSIDRLVFSTGASFTPRGNRVESSGRFRVLRKPVGMDMLRSLVTTLP